QGVGTIQRHLQRRRLRLHRYAADTGKGKGRHHCRRRRAGHPEGDARGRDSPHSAGARRHATGRRRAGPVSRLTALRLRDGRGGARHRRALHVMRPLDGITVLDLTRLLPGAAATQILANFGADVIKIEEPGRGDYAREMPPVFQMVNRGKKSAVLDLKDASGQQAFLRLAERSDIVMEGFRPGVMDRLGLGYPTLRERNVRLIYVALTGYGQDGPYAQMAGHDINYLALGGVLEPPTISSVQIADLAAGALEAVVGTLLALEARHRTGRGQFVDVAMLDGVAALQVIPLALHTAGGSNVLAGRYACYNIYQARDGRWIAVGALEPKFWATLCRGLGCESFIPDQFAEGPRQAEILAALACMFRTKDAREWFEHFKDVDACVTPAQDLDEVLADPQLRHREMLTGG